MRYKITVEEEYSEVYGDSPQARVDYRPIYTQTVEDLDLQAVIAAVNKARPRKHRRASGQEVPGD